MTAIEDLVQELADTRELPEVALGACLVRFDEAAPRLRAVLERAAGAGCENDAEATLLFRALHVLGAGRDPLACPPLLRLLRRPAGEVDYLLGDAVIQTLPRILAGVFDGNAEALFELAGDRRPAGMLRWSVMNTVAFLTWEGRIEKERTARFLERFEADRLADPGDPAWVGWQDAIGLLGLRALLPRVERAWQDELFDETLNDREDCEQLLAEAERKPGDIGRFEAEGLGYIDDLVAALGWFANGGAPDDSLAPAADDELLPYSDELSDDDLAVLSDGEPWLSRGGLAPVQSHVNPRRHVGRNDPCPCGSGKKYKKRCLKA